MIGIGSISLDESIDVVTTSGIDVFVVIYEPAVRDVIAAIAAAIAINKCAKQRNLSKQEQELIPKHHQ